MIALEQALDDKKKRLEELVGCWGRFGLIKAAKQREDREASEAADAKKERIKWKTPREWGPKEFILDRITPKRIYIRPPGSTVCEVYQRNGKALSKYDDSEIDISRLPT